MKKKVDLKKKGKVAVLSSVMSGDVEEGDSGIDANSQGSCSSTDAKNAAARVVAQTQITSSNKKDKKKKGKEVTVEVKPSTSTTNSKLSTNSAATQTNTAKVNSSQTKSNKVGIIKHFKCIEENYNSLMLDFIFRKRKIKSVQLKVKLLLVQHLPPKRRLYLK